MLFVNMSKNPLKLLLDLTLGKINFFQQNFLHYKWDAYGFQMRIKNIYAHGVFQFISVLLLFFPF